MKRLKNIISKIILIILTIYLIVFSVIPKSVQATTPTSDDGNISLKQKEIAEYAKHWVGITPYVWGGKNLQTGTDCSGFVKAVYEQFGYNIGNKTYNGESSIAANFINDGAPVSENQLELGDVIVVHWTNTNGWEWHCGIYAGNGQYINNSSSAGHVVIKNIPADSVSEKWYRRIIGATSGGGEIPTIMPNPSVSGGTDVEGNGWEPQGEIDDETVDLDSMEFEFAGTPQKVEYNGETEDPWVFSKLSQIIDYILGVFVSAIRIAVVGWTEVVEKWLSSAMHLLSGTDDDKIYTVEDIIFNKIPILDVNIFSNIAGGQPVKEDTVTGVVRNIAASWYVSARNVMTIVLMILLVYAGIRMSMSTIAETKATYKQYLFGWLKSIIVLYIVHYILILILNINGSLVNMFSGDSSQEGLIYETIRTRAYDVRFSVGMTGMFMYIILVFMFIKFAWIYAKRFLTIIILTIISPLVIGKYAYDSASGKRSTAFSNFLYLYASNILIQSAHALIYVSLVGIALDLALTNITGFILALIFMNFMLKADQIVLKLFKFDRDVGDIRAPFRKEEELAGIYYTYGAYKYAKDKDLVGRVKNIGKKGVNTVKNIGQTGVSAVKKVGGLIGDYVMSPIEEQDVKPIEKQTRDYTEKTKQKMKTPGYEKVAKPVGKIKRNIKNKAKKVEALKDKVNRTNIDKFLLNKSNEYLGKDSELSKTLVLKMASRKNGATGRLAEQVLKLRKTEKKQRYTSNFKFIASEIKGVGSVILAVPTMVLSPSVGIGLASKGISTIKKNGKQEKLRHWTTKQKIANKLTLGHYGNRVEAKEKIEKNKNELDTLVASIIQSNEAMDNIEAEFEKFEDPVEKQQAKEVMKEVIKIKAGEEKVEEHINKYLDEHSVENIDNMNDEELQNMIVNVSNNIGEESHLDKEKTNNIIKTIEKNTKENKVKSVKGFAKIINESAITANVDNRFLNIAKEINKMKEAEFSTKVAAEDVTGEDDTELININRFIDNL